MIGNRWPGEALLFGHERAEHQRPSHWTVRVPQWHKEAARPSFIPETNKHMELKEKPTPLPCGTPVRSRFARGMLAAATGAFLLSGCAWLGLDSSDDKDAEYVERPVEQIYNDAWTQIKGKDWEKAAKQFDEVERQHPYSVWARRAMLMSAFCYYQSNK